MTITKFLNICRQGFCDFDCYDCVTDWGNSNGD